jgi:hypothetical protein
VRREDAGDGSAAEDGDAQARGAVARSGNFSFASWILGRLVLRFADEFVEHLPHEGMVPAHDGGGCGDVAVGIEALPVEGEAGIAGQLLEEGALGPAVALTERVDGIHLAEIVGQPFGEHVPRKPAQDLFAVQRAEDLRRRGLNLLGQTEPVPLREGDGPELPGPVVDVAEDPAMDRAHVPQVVGGLDQCFLEEDQRGVGDLPLRVLQFPGCPQPEPMRSTPVTGSAYGSSGIYGRRYRETVLRYSSAALISPSTYAETSRSCSGLTAPGSSTCTDCAAERALSRRARWRASASYRS